jgi:hypothetical protein
MGVRGKLGFSNCHVQRVAAPARKFAASTPLKSVSYTTIEQGALYVIIV